MLAASTHVDLFLENSKQTKVRVERMLAGRSTLGLLMVCEVWVEHRMLFRPRRPRGQVTVKTSAEGHAVPHDAHDARVACAAMQFAEARAGTVALHRNLKWRGVRVPGTLLFGV